MRKSIFRELMPYVVAVVIFIIIAVIYCKPILNGMVLNQPDMSNWKGMSHEVKEYYDATGERSFWTNSMFSGMPTYQIMGSPSSAIFIGKVLKVVTLFFTSVLGIIMGYFIGFYILMRAFGINKWLSIVGAIAIAFSSYFFIIIAAGHVSKAFCLGYLAPLIGGFFLIFRKKYFWGVPLVMVYSTLCFTAHPQMSYYIMLLLAIFGVAEVYIHVKEKRFKDLGLGILLFCVSVGVGMGCKYGVIMSNAEYSRETMRGGHSELTKNSAETNNASGLSFDYATQWSYGINETMTLLIPNFKGGASGYPLPEKSNLNDALIKNRVPASSRTYYLKNAPMYWGTQPFTSGPVYVGSIICFLFLLGIFIVKGPYKWAILAATLFSVLLSWGHNFPALTKLFFYYCPMYDKFRAVSSILVVAEITIPLLAFLALKEIINNKVPRKKIFLSAGITAGICLFFALFGKTIYDFSSVNDSYIFSQMPKWFSDAVIADRAMMLQNDAFRSFVFVALSAIVLVIFNKGIIKNKNHNQAMLVVSLCLLILVDMVPVNRRFFNDDNFVDKRVLDNYFKKTPYEEQLLRDKDPNFRVLNVTSNTFNDARTSYYLKSIGGYHGAKLRRYQDIINEHISKNNINVLNMLNAKYFIVNNAENEPVAQLNPMALGNAWFVDTLLIAANPDEESEALNVINPATTAVTDKKFESFAVNAVSDHDASAYIKLISYTPNRIDYESQSLVNKTAVFSEIFYPYGWKAYIDDEKVSHFRVNYVLRALNVPSGNHHVYFEFAPDTMIKGEKIAYLFISIMFVSVAFCVVYPILLKKKEMYRKKTEL